MSLQKCKKCGLVKHISTYETEACPITGPFHDFDFYDQSPFLNIPHLTPEEIEKIKQESEKHYGPGKGNAVERRLASLEERVKKLENDNDARGLSGMRCG